MTAKKNTARTQLPKTHQGRRRKVAADKNRTAEASAAVENVPAEVAETPAKPAVVPEAAGSATDATVEASRIAAPTPAEETTTATASRCPEATVSGNPLSARDAAAKVLRETGRSMSCPELIAAMAAKGYWRSPRGRTPAGTLYTLITMLPKTA